jgi:hypothetical protein
MLRMVIEAVEPRFLLDGVPMIGLAGDDGIFQATLWMLFTLAAGVALLMLAFMFVTRCARWCSSRTAARELETESKIRPQT